MVSGSMEVIIHLNLIIIRNLETISKVSSKGARSSFDKFILVLCFVPNFDSVQGVPLLVILIKISLYTLFLLSCGATKVKLNVMKGCTETIPASVIFLVITLY